MKESLLCAITIIVYFIVIHFKRKTFSQLKKHIYSYIGVGIEIIAFLAFIASICLIINFNPFKKNINIIDFFNNQSIKVVWTVIVFVVASTIIGVVKGLLQRTRKFKGLSQEAKMEAEKRYTTMSNVLVSLSRYAIYIVSAIVILGIWQVNVLPALAGLGIAGLVIGLGAQKLIGDFVSGMFIIFEHHFDVGDVVEVGDFKGTVIDIGLKTTKIKNWEGKVKILANSELTSIINSSIYDTTFSICASVSYDLNPKLVMEKLDEGLKQRFEGRPEITDIPHTAGVDSLGDSSVDIKIVGSTKPESHYQLKRDVLQAIKEICDENGFEIPFPQLVVHEEK